LMMPVTTPATTAMALAAMSTVQLGSSALS
jgi:hypothetical protein